MSIRIADGKKIFNVASIFFILILVLLGVLQPALLCMQVADSGGDIAAGALIQTNTVHFIIVFPDFFFCFREILRG